LISVEFSDKNDYLSVIPSLLHG